MRKLYAGLKKYRGSLALIVVLLAVQAMSSLYLPDMMATIIDRGVVEGNIPFITQVGFLMLLIALAGSGASIGVGYLSSKVGVGFCTDIRKKLFHHIEKFTVGEFDHLSTSTLVTRSANDVQQLQNFSIMTFRVIVLSPLMAVGGMVLAFTQNVEMGWLVVVAMLVVAAVLPLVMRRAFPYFRAMQTGLDNVNLILRENITGVRVVRAFDAQDREESRFQKANLEMTNVSIKGQLVMAALMPLMMFIINLGTVAVIWFGGVEISQGNLQVGDMMAFIQYLVLIMFSLIMLSMIFGMAPRAAVCARRIQAVLDTEPTIVAPEDPKTPEELTGVVEFHNVALTYSGDDHPAVSGVTFRASPGKTTAIIGATGSGKSSIICLIPRLRDATEGTVTVDGVDVRDYDLEALRKRIGYVPQKANLFSGTIRSNIAYADENMPMEKVREAARVAQAEEFISSSRDGYDRPIAQGGTNVSGGQRQRLTIARAIASGGQILVFDDSFSALDFQTDAKLRSAIREYNANATILIVAQRVNTIMNADEILVLEEGRVVGQGTHKQLMETCSVYQDIVHSQISGDVAHA